MNVKGVKPVTNVKAAHLPKVKHNVLASLKKMSKAVSLSKPQHKPITPSKSKAKISPSPIKLSHKAAFASEIHSKPPKPKTGKQNKPQKSKLQNKITISTKSDKSLIKPLKPNTKHNHNPSTNPQTHKTKATNFVHTPSQIPKTKAKQQNLKKTKMTQKPPKNKPKTASSLDSKINKSVAKRKLNPNLLKDLSNPKQKSALESIDHINNVEHIKSFTNDLGSDLTLLLSLFSGCSGLLNKVFTDLKSKTAKSLNANKELPGVSKMEKDFGQAKSDFAYLVKSYSQVKKGVDNLHFSSESNKFSHGSAMKILDGMFGGK